ncbi:MAG: hypothetical protein P1S60_05795 [Anaerolineae bacterium]|nr:hypothetical protein [Anaerolineae bacterium]
MNDQQLKLWLLDYGGPAIRYRTALELLPGSSTQDLQKRKHDLLNSPMTRQWLSRLGQPGGLFSFHGSKPEAFENVAFKLGDLGLQAGTPVLDEKTAAFRQDFAQREAYTGKFIVAGALARLGYGDEPALQTFLLTRLETLYAMTRTGNYDIYIDQDSFGDFPKAFRKRRLLNPDYNGMLPSIYDMIALAYWPLSLQDAENQQKIDTIVDYVLHPDYQAFEDGYGVMRDGPHRYYSIGWSVHLPGYGGYDDMPDGRAKYFLQRLDMMSRFTGARSHRWLKESMVHLESFQQPDGTYRFPARYLREQQNGYWVTGAYTRLDEDRRQRVSLNAESTFRMLCIQRHL